MTDFKSISQNGTYPLICYEASINDEAFEFFKCNKYYNAILEHASEQQGSEYLKNIIDDSEIMACIEKFKQNDKYGSPITYNYGEYGNFSPTTLRYVSVLHEMKKLFGSFNGMDICEIGGGYGGQCLILNMFYNINSYCIIDIKEAGLLAKRYLEKHGIVNNIKIETVEDISSREYDVFISNYAITEFNRDLQDFYYEKVISKCKRGFITYNDINPNEYNSYKKEDWLKMLPNAVVLEEKPVTHQRNCVIVWGN